MKTKRKVQINVGIEPEQAEILDSIVHQKMTNGEKTTLAEVVRTVLAVGIKHSQFNNVAR